MEDTLMAHSKKEVLKILEKNKISNFTTPEDQIMMKLKTAKVETLESQKKELEDSMKFSRNQEYVRQEMDKIRAEGRKEESTTDTHKIIYEAEKRVAEEAKDVAVGERIKAENLSEPLKDLLKEKEEYNMGNVNFLKEGKYIMCSKCLDNTPHIPAWGICQRCGTQYSDKL